MKPSALVLASMVLLATAYADDDKKQDTEKANSDLAFKQTLEEANSFEFLLDGDETKKLEFQPSPLLRWSDPGAGELYGGVYVWTHEGRPEVISSIFKWFTPYKHLSAELHSLSTGKVSAIRDNEVVWHPDEPGVELKALEDGSIPAKARVLRLRQMRQIAKQFSARAAPREETALKVNLRLLSNPIYRYQSEKKGVLDGALFAFVEATDPEIILMVEARRAGDNYQWQVGFAQMNSVQLEVTRNEKQVWHRPQLAPPWSNVQNLNGRYMTKKLRD